MSGIRVTAATGQAEAEQLLVGTAAWQPPATYETLKVQLAYAATMTKVQLTWHTPRVDALACPDR